MTNIYDERYREKTAEILRQYGITLEDLARYMGITKDQLHMALETYSFELRADVSAKLFEIEDFIYKDLSYEELIVRQMDFCHITPEGLARLMRISHKHLQTLLNPPFETRKMINEALEEIEMTRQEISKMPKMRRWYLSNGRTPGNSTYRSKGLRYRAI